MKTRALWGGLLCCLAASAAFAGPGKAPKFDSYVLSLSWQPAFCESKPDKKECKNQTPDRYDAQNLVLHGLWPNQDSDSSHSFGFCGVPSQVRKLDKASTWCKMPAPDLTPDTKSTLATYMPGVASCLERHEWYKHGTCSGFTADVYFTKAYAFVKEADGTNFGRYIAANVGKTVAANDILAEYEKDFGPGTRNSVSLLCTKSGSTSLLSEIRLNLKNPLPADGGLKHAIILSEASEPGNCPADIYIDPVEGQPATLATSVAPTLGSSAVGPLLAKGHPVDWWYVFKFNASAFPGCGPGSQRDCIFGGEPQQYRSPFGQQFVYASSDAPALKKGSGCVGDTLTDPVGATFDAIYNHSLNYVIWNDQFYGDPIKTAASPWGHSKGMLAWNSSGDGFVMQVTTPSWPGSGSASFPRTDGNTLGCVTDNNVAVSQHFFGLRLTKDDVKLVLQALQNASVVTEPNSKQIVRNGGPSDIQALVKQLGKKSFSIQPQDVKLSTGVELISKPSALPVPPWQMVSALLKGTPLRTATWWASPKIDSTDSTTKIGCWSETLGKPGAVQIATTGQWQGTTFGLKGVVPNGNHAKVGVSTDPEKPYVIFGDLNQQGTISGKCNSSQNGRGGLFFVLKNQALFESVTELLKGDSAPVGQ